MKKAGATTLKFLSIALLAGIALLVVAGAVVFVRLHDERLGFYLLLSVSVVALLIVGVGVYYTFLNSRDSTLSSGLTDFTKILDSPMNSKKLRKYRDDIQSAQNISNVRDQYRILFATLKADKTPLTYELWRSLEQELERLVKAGPADLATRRTKVHNLISDTLKQLPAEQVDAQAKPGTNPAIDKHDEIDRLQKERDDLQSRLSTLTTASKQDGHDTRAFQSLNERVTSLNQQLQDQQSRLASEKSRVQELGDRLRRKEAQDAERDQELQKVKSDAEKANQQASAERQERLLFTDFRSALQHLREQDETKIGKLAEFTDKIIRSADAVSGPIKAAAASKNIAELKANLEHLDRVYEEVPAVARNANYREASLKAVQAIAVVQEHLHRELWKCKVELIDPDHLEPFNAKWHVAGEGGHKEWTTDRGQDNLVHSVLKIGFKYGDQVLRQAVIRRYVYLGSSTVANPVQETTLEGVEEMASSKKQVSPVLLSEPPQDPGEIQGASEQSLERDAVTQTAVQMAEPSFEEAPTVLEAPHSETETSDSVATETEAYSIEMGEHPVQTPEVSAIVVDLQEQKMPYAPGISTESSDLPEATIEVSPETPDEIAPEPVASTERKSGLDLMRDLLETNSKT